MRERRLNRKKVKQERLLEELKQLENAEEKEEAKEKLLSKVEKLQSQIAEAEAENAITG